MTLKEQIIEILGNAPELNMGNYDEDDVKALNDTVIEAYNLLKSMPDSTQPPQVDESRPAIEQTVIDVLDGMVGIGGIPNNGEFYTEFVFRLGAALKLSAPVQEQPDNTDSHNCDERVITYIEKRIQELREADSAACEKRWDMSLLTHERLTFRELSNELTARRQELEGVIKRINKLTPPPAQSEITDEEDIQEYFI